MTSRMVTGKRTIGTDMCLHRNTSPASMYINYCRPPEGSCFLPREGHAILKTFSQSQVPVARSYQRGDVHCHGSDVHCHGSDVHCHGPDVHCRKSDKNPHESSPEVSQQRHHASRCFIPECVSDSVHMDMSCNMRKTHTCKDAEVRHNSCPVRITASTNAGNHQTDILSQFTDVPNSTFAAFGSKDSVRMNVFGRNNHHKQCPSQVLLSMIPVKSESESCWNEFQSSSHKGARLDLTNVISKSNRVCNCDSYGRIRTDVSFVKLYALPTLRNKHIPPGTSSRASPLVCCRGRPSHLICCRGRPSPLVCCRGRPCPLVCCRGRPSPLVCCRGRPSPLVCCRGRPSPLVCYRGRPSPLVCCRGQPSPLVCCRERPSPRVCDRGRHIKHANCSDGNESEAERSSHCLSRTQSWESDNGLKPDRQSVCCNISNKWSMGASAKSFRNTLDKMSLTGSSNSCNSLSLVRQGSPLQVSPIEGRSKTSPPRLAYQDHVELVRPPETQTSTAHRQPLDMTVHSQATKLRQGIETPDLVCVSGKPFRNRFVEEYNTVELSAVPLLMTTERDSDQFGNSANALLYSSPPEMEAENWTCHSDHARNNGNETAKQQRITYRQWSAARETNRNIRTFTLPGINSDEPQTYQNINDRQTRGHGQRVANRIYLRNRQPREASNPCNPEVSLGACSSELKLLITSTIVDMQKHALSSQTDARTFPFGQPNYRVTTQHSASQSQDSVANPRIASNAPTHGNPLVSHQQWSANKNKHRDKHQEEMLTPRNDCVLSPRNRSISEAHEDDANNFETHSNPSPWEADISNSYLAMKSSSEKGSNTLMTSETANEGDSPYTGACTQSCSIPSCARPTARLGKPVSGSNKILNSDVCSSCSFSSCISPRRPLENEANLEYWTLNGRALNGRALNGRACTKLFSKPRLLDPGCNKIKCFVPETGDELPNVINLVNTDTSKEGLERAASEMETQLVNTNLQGQVSKEHLCKIKNHEMCDSEGALKLEAPKQTRIRILDQGRELSQRNNFTPATATCKSATSGCDANIIVKYLQRKYGKKLHVDDPKVDRIINFIANRTRGGYKRAATTKRKVGDTQRNCLDQLVRGSATCAGSRGRAYRSLTLGEGNPIEGDSCVRKDGKRWSDCHTWEGDGCFRKGDKRWSDCHTREGDGCFREDDKRWSDCHTREGDPRKNNSARESDNVLGRDALGEKKTMLGRGKYIGSDNSGRDNSGRDNSGSDNSGRDNSGSDNIGRDNSGKDNRGKDNSGSDNSGKDNIESDNRESNYSGSDNRGSGNNSGIDNINGRDNKSGSENHHGSDNIGSDKISESNNINGSDNSGSDNKSGSNKKIGSDNKSGSDNKIGSDNNGGSDNKSGSDNKNGSDNINESDNNDSESHNESAGVLGSDCERGSEGHNRKSTIAEEEDNDKGRNSTNENDSSPERDSSPGRNSGCGNEKLSENYYRPKSGCHRGNVNNRHSNRQTSCGECVSRGQGMQSNESCQSMAAGTLHCNLYRDERNSRTKMQHKGNNLMVLKRTCTRNTAATGAGCGNNIGGTLPKLGGVRKNDNSMAVSLTRSNAKRTNSKHINALDECTRTGLLKAVKCATMSHIRSANLEPASKPNRSYNRHIAGDRSPESLDSLSSSSGGSWSRMPMPQNPSSGSLESTAETTVSSHEVSGHAFQDFNVSRRGRTGRDVNTLHKKSTSVIDDKKRLLEEIKKSPWDKRKVTLLKQFLSISKQHDQLQDPDRIGQGQRSNEGELENGPKSPPKASSCYGRPEYCLNVGLHSQTSINGDEQMNMASHCIHQQNSEVGQIASSYSRIRISNMESGDSYLEENIHRRSCHSKAGLGSRQLIVMPLSRNSIEKCLTTGEPDISLVNGDQSEETSLYVAEVIDSSSNDTTYDEKRTCGNGREAGHHIRLSSSGGPQTDSPLESGGRIFHTLAKSGPGGDVSLKRKDTTLLICNRNDMTERNVTFPYAQNGGRRSTSRATRIGRALSQGKSKFGRQLDKRLAPTSAFGRQLDKRFAPTSAFGRQLDKRFAPTSATVPPKKVCGSVTSSEITETVPAYVLPRHKLLYMNSHPSHQQEAPNTDKARQESPVFFCKDSCLRDGHAIQRLVPGGKRPQLFNRGRSQPYRRRITSPPSIQFDGEQVSFMEIIPKGDKFRGLRFAKVDDLRFSKDMNMLPYGQIVRKKSEEKSKRTAALKKSTVIAPIAAAARDHIYTPSSVTFSRSRFTNDPSTTSSSWSQSEIYRRLFGKDHVQGSDDSSTDTDWPSWTFSESDETTDSSEDDIPGRRRKSSSGIAGLMASTPSPVGSLKLTDSVSRGKTSSRSTFSMNMQRLSYEHVKHRDGWLSDESDSLAFDPRETHNLRSLIHGRGKNRTQIRPGFEDIDATKWNHVNRKKDWDRGCYSKSGIFSDQSGPIQTATHSRSRSREIDQYEKLRRAANKLKIVGSLSGNTPSVKPEILRINSNTVHTNRECMARIGAKRGTQRMYDQSCYHGLQQGRLSSSSSLTIKRPVQHRGQTPCSQLYQQDCVFFRAYTDKKRRQIMRTIASKENTPRKSASPSRKGNSGENVSSLEFVNADGATEEDQEIEDLEHVSLSSRGLIVHFKDGALGMGGVEFGICKNTQASQGQILPKTAAIKKKKKSSKKSHDRKLATDLSKRTPKIKRERFVSGGASTQCRVSQAVSHKSTKKKLMANSSKTPSTISRLSVPMRTSPRLVGNTKGSVHSWEDNSVGPLSVGSPPPSQKRHIDEFRDVRNCPVLMSPPRNAPDGSGELQRGTLLTSREHVPEEITSPRSKCRTRLLLRTADRADYRAQLTQARGFNSGSTSPTSGSPSVMTTAGNYPQYNKPSKLVCSLSEITNMLSPVEKQHFNARILNSKLQPLSDRTSSDIDRTPIAAHMRTTLDLKGKKRVVPKNVSGRVRATSPLVCFGSGHKRTDVHTDNSRGLLQTAVASTRRAPRTQSWGKTQTISSREPRISTGYGISQTQHYRPPAKLKSKSGAGSTRASFDTYDKAILPNERNSAPRVRQIVKVQSTPHVRNIVGRQRRQREFANFTSNKQRKEDGDMASPDKQSPQDVKKRVQFGENVERQQAICSPREGRGKTSLVYPQQDKIFPNRVRYNPSPDVSRLKPHQRTLFHGCHDYIPKNCVQPSYFSKSPKKNRINHKNIPAIFHNRDIATSQANYPNNKMPRECERRMIKVYPDLKFAEVDLQFQKVQDNNYESDRDEEVTAHGRHCRHRKRGSSEGKLHERSSSQKVRHPVRCQENWSDVSQEDETLPFDRIYQTPKMEAPSTRTTSISSQLNDITNNTSPDNSSLFYNTTDDVSASAIFDNSSPVHEYPARNNQKLTNLKSSCRQKHPYRHKLQKAQPSQQKHKLECKVHYKTNEHHKHRRSPSFKSSVPNHETYPETMYSRTVHEMQRPHTRHRRFENVN